MGFDQAWVLEYLRALAPDGMAFHELKEPLQPDEARWFRRVVAEEIVTVDACGPTCSRNRRAGFQRVDEFVANAGSTGKRHLLSFTGSGLPNLNREYIPHVAAHARVVIELGYPAEHAAFSEYRTFKKTWRTKHEGQGYEVDALFRANEGQPPLLQIEAKGTQMQTAALAANIKAARLSDMHDRVAKEVEYVLELRPSFLWVVGPGSVEPERYVFRVESLSDSDVRFDQVGRLPRFEETR